MANEDTARRPADDPWTRLAPGDSARRSWTVTQEQIEHFAAATGDFNPIHFDDATGRASVFGSTIAHGMLSAGFISAVIGTQLPGAGSIYLNQSLRFRKPVRAGDVITAEVEVLELNEERRHVRLRTHCVNQAGDVVVDGEALILVPRPRS